MKILSNPFTYIFFISLALSSCSSSPNSLSTIPNSVGLVTNVNLLNVTEKAGVASLSELYSFKNFKKELRTENKDLYKIIDEVVNSPASTGIDFSKDLFMFYLNEVKDEHYFSFAFDLDDSEVFSTFIEQELLDLEDGLEIQAGKNFSYVLFNKEFGIGWDTEKAIVLIPENYRSKDYIDFELDNLFNLKETARISTNPSFTKFFDERKDISVWLNTNFFLNTEKFDQIRNNLFFDLEDQSLFTYLTFNNGELKVTSQLDGSGDLIEILNELSLWNKNDNKIATQLIPKDTYASANISVNPEAINDLLFESIDNYEQFKTDFKNEMKVPLSEVINSMDGTASFSLDDFGMREMEYQKTEMVYNEKKYREYNYYTREYYYKGGYDYIEKTVTREEFTPLMGLTIGLKNNSFINDFISELPEELIEDHKAYISFDIDNGLKVYATINETFIYFSNDEEKIRNLSMNKFEIPEKDRSNNQELLASSDLYFSAKLNFDNYPKELKKQLRDMQNSEEVKLFRVWNDFAKNIEIIKNQPNHLEVVFSTNNASENSLASFIEFLDEGYKTMN